MSLRIQEDITVSMSFHVLFLAVLNIREKNELQLHEVVQLNH